MYHIQKQLNLKSHISLLKFPDALHFKNFLKPTFLKVCLFLERIFIINLMKCTKHSLGMLVEGEEKKKGIENLFKNNKRKLP